MTKDIYFSVDAKTILQLGRDSIKDATTALLELVKNSYDADATNVDIQINIDAKGENSYIRIADNGDGMDLDDIIRKWLRIGFSEKSTLRVSKLGRRKTGEKGIGRISADRLGSVLNLTTIKEGGEIASIKVSWDDFDVVGAELSSIPIRVVSNPQINLPKASDHGTELIIEGLRQPWSAINIENLHLELSVLTPPFVVDSDFTIELKHNLSDQFQGRIVSPFYDYAEITFEASYYPQNNNVEYSISDMYGKEKKGNITWDRLSQKIFDPSFEYTPEKLECGPVKLKFLFYTRESKLLKDTDLTLGNLREFLDKNTGVKIYRDNIRVLPYGSSSSGGDWLGISERKTRNPAAMNRPDWHVSASQLIGGLFIGRDANPSLTDSSGREGLIEENPFFDLRAFSLGCLSLLETYRYELYRDNPDIKQKKQTPTESVSEVSQDLEALKDELKEKQSQPTQATDLLEIAVKKVEDILEKNKSAEESVSAQEEELRILRSLATIGISSTVFGHEIQSSIAGFKTAIAAANACLQEEELNLEEVNEEIKKSLSYSSKVSSWGAFALTRIQKEKRVKKKINIRKLIESVVNDIDKNYKNVNIQLTQGLTDIDVMTYPIDIESIVLNLLTNAYWATLQKSKDRKINIELMRAQEEGKEYAKIIISDSGNGVPEEFLERIWEPLFTTKKDALGKENGTGLGLSIVSSILKQLNGKAEVGVDPKLKGASFSIYIPIK